MKKFVLLLFLLFFVFVSAEITSEEVVGDIGDRVGDIARNTNVYAELLGENLLKFQELFMGTLSFVSLGFIDGSGDMDFANFLVFILLFMVIYSIVGLVFDRFNFAMAFIITILAFIGLDEKSLEAILLNYEALGIAITIILPVLVLLAFTFRIYQKAYEGDSKTSPFYAEIFNLVFLIFFGVFFIRYSGNEEGVISAMRFACGWIMIGMGIAQCFLYDIVSSWFHRLKRDSERFRKDIRKERQDAVDEINKINISNMD